MRLQGLSLVQRVLGSRTRFVTGAGPQQLCGAGVGPFRSVSLASDIPV